MRIEIICDCRASQWFLTPDVSIWRTGERYLWHGFAIQFLRGRIGFYIVRPAK